MPAIPVSNGEEVIAYTGKIFAVIEKPMKIGDKEVTFEIARRAPGTKLIIISKDKKILLTKEYRRETDSSDFRLPGGKVFDTLQVYQEVLASKTDIEEKAKEAAKVEALEEAGINITGDLELFYKSSSGATVDWDLYYFVVRDFEETEQKLGAGEDSEVDWYTSDEILELVKKGQMQEDRSIGLLVKFILQQ